MKKLYERSLTISKVFLPTVLLLVCGRLVAAEAAHPDFSGVWEAHVDRSQPRSSGFGGAAAGLPLTEEGKQRIADYAKLIGPERANPAAYCVDYGVPTMMEMPGGYPLEFLQTANQLNIVYEVENETRRIYIGERQLAPEKRLSSRDGYSMGRWEGDVLVVTTTDLLDAQDQSGHPHSDQAVIEERFALSEDANGMKLITYDASITDPVYYTEPVKLHRMYQPMQDGFVIPYRCPDDFWYELLDMRRAQVEAGEEVSARMSDVYKAREDKE